ncbi:hypothetical protein EIP86_000679 [Pleurotus ostreatoroseus]|nr:hypothetical protein EIP86_000679 [Pleurotus ostreatoroseus]
MDNFTNMMYTGSHNPGDDSTASGGYGSSKNVWSDKVQRGRAQDEPMNTAGAGLIDQSTNGGPLGQEVQDAIQGKDAQTREEYAHEAERDFGMEAQPRSQGLNPYGQNPDNKDEVAEMLSRRNK